MLTCRPGYQDTRPGPHQAQHQIYTSQQTGNFFHNKNKLNQTFYFKKTNYGKEKGLHAWNGLKIFPVNWLPRDSSSGFKFLARLKTSLSRHYPPWHLHSNYLSLRYVLLGKYKSWLFRHWSLMFPLKRIQVLQIYFKNSLIRYLFGPLGIFLIVRFLYESLLIGCGYISFRPTKGTKGGFQRFYNI